jgi:hypothetical protein
LPIEKQAVSSSDGQLKGKYHRECFNCHECHVSAPDLSLAARSNNVRCRNPSLTGRSTSLMANRSVHITITRRITPCAPPHFAGNQSKVHVPFHTRETATTPSTSHVSIPGAGKDWSNTGKSMDGCCVRCMPPDMTEANGTTITEEAQHKTRRLRSVLRSSSIWPTAWREVA